MARHIGVGFRAGAASPVLLVLDVDSTDSCAVFADVLAVLVAAAHNHRSSLNKLLMLSFFMLRFFTIFTMTKLQVMLLPFFTLPPACVDVPSTRHIVLDHLDQSLLAAALLEVWGQTTMPTHASGST